MNVLLNKYIPRFTYNEIHQIVVDCNQQNAFLITKELDIKPSFISKVLLKLRGLPTKDLTLQGFIGNVCFVYLEEDLYDEFIIDASQKKLAIFWNFSFESLPGKQTIIRTETRILCLTKSSKIFFSIYWLFVKPFSGIIRKEMLRLIKRKVDHQNTGSFSSGKH